jgi:hypothetical protein
VRPHDISAPSSHLNRVRSITEIAANVAIVCAVVVGGLVWLHRIATNSSRTATSVLAVAPAPGTTIKLTGVDWSVQASTLIVAISSTCPHCVNDTPFYHDITKSAHRIPIIVVMPQQKQTAQSFLDAHNVTPSRAISADLGGIRVNVTPTLMLISSAGVVKQTWVGELNDMQRHEVTTALDHL